MKSLLSTTLFLFYLFSSTLSSEENCVEQPSDPCAGETEYTAYITCLDENKRHKRSIGCPLAQADSCEYVDCQSCQESCLPDCPDCECPSSCRQCCSETCSTNLCCHKTCHNQCKTNYCRTECKKECKERINQQSYDSDIGVNVIDNSSLSNQAKHNITTIINLHNIINNTNVIDIPIKINNTNYNNITLRRTQQSHMELGFRGQEGKEPEPDPETGEKCCYVVSPRQCVKTNYHPFMKCFHYRHKKCGPFCVATIVHAQNQNYCDDTGCHNKVFYIPQTQPKCYYTPNYPFVNCGGHHSFHNCQGCYDHVTPGSQTTGIHHHTRCAKCYDNSGGIPVPPGGSMMPGYPMGGYPMGGYPMGGYPMGGYPMGGYHMGGYYGGYPPILPPMPMYQQYPSYGQQPGFGPPGYGQQFFGQGQQLYGQGQQFYGGMNPDMSGQMDNDILDSSSSENYNEMKYPVGSVGHYVHETVIPADKLLKSGTTLNDQSNKTNLTEDSNASGSRYALISIDSAKPSYHDKREDKKERRYRRKKEKHEHEHTTEKKKEEILATEKKSTAFSSPK